MKLFLICDIDNTLSLFMHTAALLKLHQYLRSRSFLSKSAAEQMTRFVNSCYESFHSRGYGRPHDQERVQLIEEMALCVENHGGSDIFWSRELWLYAASGVAERTVSAKLAVDAAEVYWKAIEASARMYEDVEEFFEGEWWDAHRWELVLVTSSDARLHVADDGNRLVYDPDHSNKAKRLRISTPLCNISGNNIFVGDPIGKPDPRFWQEVVTTIGYEPDEDVAVMVGDSPAVDLAGLPEGFVPILVDRDKEKRGGEVKEARYIIHGFDSLPFILEQLEKERL